MEGLLSNDSLGVSLNTLIFCQCGNVYTSYTMAARLPNSFVGQCFGYFRCLYVVCECIYKQYVEEFMHKTQRYAHTDSFGSLLNITYRFGNVGVWHIPIRQTLIGVQFKV